MSNILIVRSIAKPEFEPADSAFLDLAMTAVPYFHASVVENIPSIS